MNALMVTTKRLLSYLKTDWDLDDYPIRTWRNPNAGEVSVAYGAGIINWPTMVGHGETTTKAIEDLSERFQLYKDSCDGLPRPGTKVPLQFASTEYIDKYEDIAVDFFKRVLEMDYYEGFYSDDSMLAYFEPPDEEGAKQMREEIIRIQKEMSITTVYVTHDQHEALSISDRVAVMDLGYVQQFANPREISSDPQTVFVADFIGQCTFIDGTVEARGKEIKVGIPNNQHITGHSTIDGYPFDVGESVKVAVRPEDLNLQKERPNDNEIIGEVYRTIYVGNALEVHFKVGDIDAQAMLNPDVQFNIGDPINLFVQKHEVMVLPLGGVEALRKVPGHPLFEAPAPSASVPGAWE